MEKKAIGLYFGSFNPIHIGHLIIGNYIAEHSNLHQVWWVVSPQNPLKAKKTLLDNYARLELVRLALEDYDKLTPCDVEFALPKPSYTTHTLAYLEEKYPQYAFSLIMGEDNLNTLHKWKNYELILERYPIKVYPRLGAEKGRDAIVNHPNVQHISAPIIELSSTLIRHEIAEGKNVRPMLPPKVWDYIDKYGYYL